MNIQMPNLDGLRSTRLIRKMGYVATIVALTAFSEESNVEECMESGMNELLSKPIRRPALKQENWKLIRGSYFTWVHFNEQARDDS